METRFPTGAHPRLRWEPRRPVLSPVAARTLALALALLPAAACSSRRRALRLRGHPLTPVVLHAAPRSRLTPQRPAPPQPGEEGRQVLHKRGHQRLGGLRRGAGCPAARRAARHIATGDTPATLAPSPAPAPAFAPAHAAAGSEELPAPLIRAHAAGAQFEEAARTFFYTFIAAEDPDVLSDLSQKPEIQLQVRALVLAVQNQAHHPANTRLSYPARAHGRGTNCRSPRTRPRSTCARLWCAPASAPPPIPAPICKSPRESPLPRSLPRLSCARQRRLLLRLRRRPHTSPSS